MTWVFTRLSLLGVILFSALLTGAVVVGYAVPDHRVAFAAMCNHPSEPIYVADWRRGLRVRVPVFALYGNLALSPDGLAHRLLKCRH